MPAIENVKLASSASIWVAALSGLLFNVANILLVVAIDAAGMSIAFPVGIGLALIIGTVTAYMQQPKGNAPVLFFGVLFVLAAMILSALAYRKLPRTTTGSWGKGMLFAIVAGCLMGFFYPQLIRSLSPGLQFFADFAGQVDAIYGTVLFLAGCTRQQHSRQHDFYASRRPHISRILCRYVSLALTRRSGRRNLDARVCAERDRIGSGRTGYLVRLGSGRNSDCGHLGRRDLERISSGAARDHALSLAYVRRICSWSAADRVCQPRVAQKNRELPVSRPVDIVCRQARR